MAAVTAGHRYPVPLNAPRAGCVTDGMTDSGRDDNAGVWLTEYRAPLVGFVLPMVNGDFQAAEDVVQETMLRGWQHAGELRAEHAGGWLHTVARNVAHTNSRQRA
jgi:RNA polymerase sigma-70 factor, ECF subfamily